MQIIKIYMGSFTLNDSLLLKRTKNSDFNSFKQYGIENFLSHALDIRNKLKCYNMYRKYNS